MKKLTIEDKELLFKDLSSRLPYHVRLKVWVKDGTIEEGLLDLEHNYADVLLDAFYYNKIIDIKPVLRPMSSMTKEEQKEFESLGWRVDELDYNYPWVHNGDIENVLLGFDWLNAHHFDYHGLIPMGLAIKAPEEMYK